MRHHLRFILLILFLSSLPFVTIFTTPLLPHTSDGGVQIPRMVAYIQALRDGHVPVRWAGELNYGYGLPLFNFIYHIPFLVSSVFIQMGLSLVMTFKLVLFISFFLSGLTMYAFTYSLWKNQPKALFVTMFYQFAPFRLVELLIRGAIGGIYAYAFFPLVLFGINRLWQTHRYRWFALIATSTAALIISHNSLALIFFSIALSYAVLFSKHIRQRLSSVLALACGLGLSSWYWVPALLEHKYTYGDLFMKSLYLEHFPPIQNFFIPNLFYSETLRTAEISVQFGLFHTLALFLMLFLLWKRVDQNRRLFLWVSGITTISIFFMISPSRVFWDHISMLRQFQFPWRLLAVISFTSSLSAIATYELSFVKKRPMIAWCIVALTVISTAYYWYPRQGFEKADENAFWQYPLNTTYFGEADLIWSAGPASAFPKQRLEVIGGKGVVRELQRKTQLHTYQVDAEMDVQLVEHTQYYPGWRVYVDGVKTPIEFQDTNWRGQITFTVPKGTHEIRVEFGENPLRLSADAVAVITGILLFVGATRLALIKRFLCIS